MLKHMLIAIVAAFAFAPAASAETPSAPAAPPAPAAAAAAAAPAAPAPPAPVAPAPAPVAAPLARREEAEGNQRPSLADRINAFKNGHAGTAALTGQISTLTAERDQARQQLGTVTAERDDFRRQLADVEAALSGQQNIVKATASEIASTVGMPLASLPAPMQGHGENVYDQWLEAKGSAKSAIYRENREKIRAEAKRQGVNI